MARNPNTCRRTTAKLVPKLQGAFDGMNSCAREAVAWGSAPLAVPSSEGRVVRPHVDGTSRSVHATHHFVNANKSHHAA